MDAKLQQFLDEFVDAAGGHPLFTLARPLPGNRAEVLAVCVAADGSSLVVASLDGTGEGAVLSLNLDEAAQLAAALQPWLRA